jgi:DNA-binding PadR family transcriptional regulator
LEEGLFMHYTLDAADSARHTLLGLLLGGPCHGYDLARHFAPATPLGDVVHLSPSHLYALLAQLERDGLISGERQDSGPRPPRRVYQLTERGRADVLRWVDEPVARPRDMHLGFPLKYYLACRLGRPYAEALIARQRDLFTAYLTDLENAAVPEGAPHERAFLAVMREGRIGRTRAALAWLDRCAAVVAAVSAQPAAGGSPPREASEEVGPVV